MHLHGNCTSPPSSCKIGTISPVGRRSFSVAVQLQAFHLLLHISTVSLWPKQFLAHGTPHVLTSCLKRCIQYCFQSIITTFNLTIQLTETISPPRFFIIQVFNRWKSCLGGRWLDSVTHSSPPILLHGLGDTSPYTSGSHDGDGVYISCRF